MRSIGQWTVIVTGVVVVAGSLFAIDGSDTTVPSQKQQQTSLMLLKLSSSQRITNGLVSKDFEEIRRGAAELIRVCDAIGWANRGDQIYSQHRNELRRQAQKLTRMADDENLDGAAFVYMNSLSTCISCHEYSRDVLRIAEDKRTKYKIVPIPVSEDEATAPEKRTSKR